MQSPEYVQISLAAAITLKLKPGRFYRDARLTGLNLLLTYDGGCGANCAYCGLSRDRRKNDTFIRVAWPTYSVDEILGRLHLYGKDIRRICIQMVTHPSALSDMIALTATLREKTNFPVSVLVSPTLLSDRSDLHRLHDAGADKIGIAVDCATAELFDKYRGSGVRGPHKWDRYWEYTAGAASVFGRHMAGIHLVTGLGETEYDLCSVMQRAYDLGALTHLFSFFPERGSALGNAPQPDIDSYRRVQLMRYLINEDISSMDRMKFAPDGKVADFGISRECLSDIIRRGTPFMTSGCTGPDGIVACNRPFGNERPSEPMRNYPFLPESCDIDDVFSQLNPGQNCADPGGCIRCRPLHCPKEA